MSNEKNIAIEENRTAINIYSSRVNQLDALALDKEFYSLIESLLERLWQIIQVSKINAFSPEIEATVKYYIWSNTIRKNGSSIGQKLLGLRYYDASQNNSMKLRASQIYGSACITIILPYLLKRASRSSRNAAQRDVIEFLESTLTCLRLCNSLLFLNQGVYRNVWERVLRMRCGPIEPDSEPEFQPVQYEFMNRELLWHAFAEFLAFILPLINFYSMRNMVRNFVRSYLWPPPASATTVTDLNNRTLSDYKKCAVCHEWPVNAHEIGCCHVFCYYCLMSNFLADKSRGFRCAVCLHEEKSIDAIKRVKIRI